jgi:hypothetical protein
MPKQKFIRLPKSFDIVIFSYDVAFPGTFLLKPLATLPLGLQGDIPSTAVFV